jgi:hypothetical protein
MMTGWQDIETAPKDGTRILLGSPGNEPVIGCWVSDSFAHGDEASDLPYGRLTDPRWVPTHWMPLPEAPR